MKSDRLWVDPKFKKKMKQEAAERDISIIELTDILADDSDEFVKTFRKKDGKKKLFNFKF